MRRFFVYGAGEYYGEDHLKPEAGDFVLAADGGLKHVSECGIKPDMILGDFDSLGYVPSGVNVVKLPTHKDYTDTGMAVRIGLDRGYNEFHVFGGTGGRIDHTLSNISDAAYLARHGARCYIHGNGVIITVIENCRLSFPAGNGGTFSAFSYTENCTVKLEGFEYEAENCSLSNLFPLGVSNSFTGREAAVTVKSGMLLIVCPESAFDGVQD